MLTYPLEEGVTLYLHIFDLSLPWDTLCQICFKSAERFLTRLSLTYLKVFKVCSLYGYDRPFQMCMALISNTIEIPLLNRTLCQVYLKFDQRMLNRRLSKVMYIVTMLLLSPLSKQKYHEVVLPKRTM